MGDKCVVTYPLEAEKALHVGGVADGRRKGRKWTWRKMNGGGGRGVEKIVSAKKKKNELCPVGDENSRRKNGNSAHMWR